jgi:hypothetical protein
MTIEHSFGGIWVPAKGPASLLKATGNFFGSFATIGSGRGAG